MCRKLCGAVRGPDRPLDQYPEPLADVVVFDDVPDAAATLATLNPWTPFPVAWPGEVSFMKV